MTTAKCSSPPVATSLSFASLTMRVPRLCVTFGLKTRMPTEFGPWQLPRPPVTGIPELDRAAVAAAEAVLERHVQEPDSLELASSAQRPGVDRVEPTGAGQLVTVCWRSRSSPAMKRREAARRPAPRRASQRTSWAGCCVRSPATGDPPEGQEARAAARIASAERLASSAVVCQPTTDTRMTAWPRKVLPLSQQVPSCWVRSMTAFVA